MLTFLVQLVRVLARHDECSLRYPPDPVLLSHDHHLVSLNIPRRTVAPLTSRSCFTDCAAATALAYEKPEADVLLRRPRNTKTDRLVDFKLIGYAYGVTGLIETLCSFTMSFWYLQKNGIPFSAMWLSYGNLPDWIDPDYYAQKINEASCIYFVNLVVMQWFNLMAVRTRRWSVIQHPPLFNKHTQNWLLFPAVLFALAMVFLWCYIPPLQVVIITAEIPVEHFFIPMGFGMALLLIDETRKYLIRKYPAGLLARIAW